MSMTIGNPKPYPAGTQLKGIVTPHEHDVLSGRGNFVNYHTGNEHFRSLVKKHKIAYVACPKPEKGRFSKVIVDEIRSMDPPGRFLKQNQATKLWEDIGDKKSLDKTRQALREGAPELLKELTGEDPKQKNLQPQSMAAAQAQIQSGGMTGGGAAGAGMLNAGAMGHTPDQQQYFMQQMAQLQAQQQQRHQAQMGMGMSMGNMAGGFQVEQVSSSHGVGFGGDAAAGGGGIGGFAHSGAPQQMGVFLHDQHQGGLNADNDSNNNGSAVPGAPAMVPINVINPSGAPLDADAQAQQDRLIQQQQLLQQQHQKLLEQQELLRQLQEQQRAMQQQQLQAVQLEQQQQRMVGGVNSNFANMTGMAGMTDFPGVPGGIGAMNSVMMQSIQQQPPQATSTGADNCPPENVSSLLHKQEQTVPVKPPAPSGGAGAGRTNRRGSLTFDDLVKGIKSAKAAQKMGMSSTNMSLSMGDIDSNLSSAFEDSLIISVEGSLANSSNSEKKPAAAVVAGSGNVAPASQDRPIESNGPGGVPENVTVNQQQQEQQPGSGAMGESSMLRGMAMSDAGMSFSLSDAADLLGGSVMQMSYRGFPESKQGDQGK